jgi:hypothetical protein
MKRCAVACCVLLCVAACKKAPERPALPPANTIYDEIDLDDVDGPNLLSLARGASIVSRTAENTLENSAAHMIDGDWLTFWRSPPSGPEQTIVISLPARARIDRVGAIIPPGAEVPPRMRFDASDDATTWREITTIVPKQQRDPQLARVAPFDARYLRVETIGIVSAYAAIRSLVAKGQFLEPPRQPPIEGCWHINGMPARFSRRGTSVAGVIGSDPPLYVLGGYVLGGTEGVAIRVTWMRGKMWGPAILTLDPQRRALSGARWYERVRDANSGEGWFGAPAQCNDVAFNETKLAEAMLQRAGKWMAYGTNAIDTLAELVAQEPLKRFAVTVHSAAEAQAVRNALRANLARVEITNAGEAKGVTATQRAIADGVELRAR